MQKRSSSDHAPPHVEDDIRSRESSSSVSRRRHSSHSSSREEKYPIVDQESQESRTKRGSRSKKQAGSEKQREEEGEFNSVNATHQQPYPRSSSSAGDGLGKSIGNNNSHRSRTSTHRASTHRASKEESTNHMMSAGLDPRVCAEYEMMSPHTNAIAAQLSLQSLVSRLRVRLNRYLMPHLIALFYGRFAVSGGDDQHRAAIDDLEKFYALPRRERFGLGTRYNWLPRTGNILMTNVMQWHPDFVQVLEFRLSYEVALQSFAMFTGIPLSKTHGSSVSGTPRMQFVAVPQFPIFVHPIEFFDRLVHTCASALGLWCNCNSRLDEQGKWNLQTMQNILDEQIEWTIDQFIPLQMDHNQQDHWNAVVQIGRQQKLDPEVMTFLSHREPWLRQIMHYYQQGNQRVKLAEAKDRAAFHVEPKPTAASVASAAASSAAAAANQKKDISDEEFHLSKCAQSLSRLETLIERLSEQMIASVAESKAATAELVKHTMASDANKPAVPPEPPSSEMLLSMLMERMSTGTKPVQQAQVQHAQVQPQVQMQQHAQVQAPIPFVAKTNANAGAVPVPSRPLAGNPQGVPTGAPPVDCEETRKRKELVRDMLKRQREKELQNS